MDDETVVIPRRLLRHILIDLRAFLMTIHPDMPSYRGVQRDIEDAEALLYAPVEGSVSPEEYGAPTDEELARWAKEDEAPDEDEDDWPEAWPDYDPTEY